LLQLEEALKPLNFSSIDAQLNPFLLHVTCGFYLQVSINWCVCKGTLPIPGAKNAQQLDDIAGALG
jgi:hypothetical protein